MTRQRSILKRQIEARGKLWPNLDPRELWGTGKQNWSAVPRIMPLLLNIMDDLSGKGFPVGRTYLELWCRLREEMFLAINRQEEMAFHAGFEGQRAVRTWRDRVDRLSKLGFIDLAPGPFGDASYALFYNPYYVTKRAYIDGKVNERKWLALLMRANEINCSDLDEIDDAGQIVKAESDVPVKSRPRRAIKKQS